MHLYVDMVKQAGRAWVEDRAPAMGAALAFYSAFSLAPLLIIVIALAGAVFGLDAARGAIVGQLAGLVGPRAAGAIQALLAAAQETSGGALATGVGLVTMLIGFVLLVSLAWSGAMSAFGTYFASYFPAAALLLLLLANHVFSVCAAAVLFAMLYKWLPNVPIAWKDVWMGAFITAVLFSAGRIAIGIYLGRSAIASAYGAAGTLIVLLLWLYYSAQVFLLGAEFTCVYAKHRARQVKCMA